MDSSIEQLKNQLRDMDYLVEDERDAMMALHSHIRSIDVRFSKLCEGRFLDQNEELHVERIMHQISQNFATKVRSNLKNCCI